MLSDLVWKKKYYFFLMFRKNNSGLIQFCLYRVIFPRNNGNVHFILLKYVFTKFDLLSGTIRGSSKSPNAMLPGALDESMRF